MTNLHSLLKQAVVLANTTAKTYTDAATRQRTRMVVQLMSQRVTADAATKTLINRLCHRLETAQSAEGIELLDFEPEHNKQMVFIHDLDSDCGVRYA